MQYNTSINRESKCEPRSLTNQCAPGRSNIPMLEMHGGGDDVISFHGGWRKDACLPALRHWAKDWARRDNLDLNPAEKSVKGADKSALQYVYGDGLVTLLYAGDDVGHVWMTDSNAGFEASDRVMAFFGKYHL